MIIINHRINTISKLKKTPINFGVEIDLSTFFSGSILWSVNGNTDIYATEQVRGDTKFNRHMKIKKHHFTIIIIKSI